MVTMSTTISVLIADDHAVLRQGLRRLIDEEPDMCVVAEARDGLEAVRLAQEHTPAVAILDISMPLLDGIEAGVRVSAVSPSTRILLLTAYDSPEYVKRALQAGITGYLLKQVDTSTLKSSIRLVCSGELVIDSAPTADLLQILMEKQAPSQKDTQRPVLNPRELEVLGLVAQGRSNKEVGAALFISERTVQSHMLNTFKKLGVTSRTAAVLHALRQGWVKMDELP